MRRTLFFIVTSYLGSLSSLYAQDCYKTSQYGIIVEKCTYQMSKGATLVFDNSEVYICQIETADENGLKCEIMYKNGVVNITSSGIIRPIVEEIPSDNGPTRITYKSHAWDFLNFNELKIIAHQEIIVVIIKKIN